MSQQTVLNLIKRSKTPLSCMQISQKLKLSPGTVNSNVRRLARYGEIRWKTENFKGYRRNVYFKQKKRL